MKEQSISSVEHVCEIIDEIRNINDEWQLVKILRECICALGAESFVYTWFLGDQAVPDHAGNENRRYLVGCDPAWTQLYIARKWFMNDPFVAYSKANAAPILGSQIQPITDGQRDLLRAAAEYGFRSAFVIPSHAGIINHMGMLYLGSSADPEEGEQRMSENRIYFRALAAELLDWWIARVREKAQATYKLDKIELQVLKLGKDGYAAKEMAIELDISLPTMYAHYRRIKSKFSVTNIHEAVHIASRSGLLSHGVI